MKPLGIIYLITVTPECADHPKHRGAKNSPLFSFPSVQSFTDMRTVAFVALMVMFSAFAVGAEKRDWQTGKVLSSERQLACPRGVDCVFQDFQIEGDKKTYTARERLKWRWSKEANVTVNGPVMFAVDAHERHLFIIDDDGKEHEMQIISKALRQ